MEDSAANGRKLGQELTIMESRLQPICVHLQQKVKKLFS